MHGSFSTNNLSAWFEVNHRNGTTYSYGKKPTSRIEFNRNDTMCCAAWYITNAKDKYGNEIEYNYTQRNFCVVPNRIIYGTNHNNPRGITCEIDFEYRDIPVENRTKFFISNRQGLISQALSTISRKVNGQLFRQYNFEYDDNADKSSKRFSRLAKIVETNNNGDSYPPIVIEWNTLQEATLHTTDHSISIDYSNRFQQEKDRAFFAVDINGDGISDIIKKSFIYDKSGLSSGTYLYVYESNIDRDGNVTFTSSVMNHWFLGNKVSFDQYKLLDNELFATDIDGDGYNDIISQSYECFNGDSYHVYYQIAFGRKKGDSYNSSTIVCIPKNKESEHPITATLDVNGDGKDEIIMIENKATSSDNYSAFVFYLNQKREFEYGEFSLSLEKEPEKCFVGDYNNDGLIDLIVLYEHGYKIFYNNGYEGALSDVFCNDNSVTHNNAYLENCRIVRQGDFNGDGLIDFICSKSDDRRLFIEYNNGNGTFSETITSDTGMCDQSGTAKDDNDFTLLVLDLDKDGRSDVMLTKSMFKYHSEHSFYRYDYGEGTTYVKWYQSTGDNLTLVASYSKKNRELDASPKNVFTGDFDGDGAVEVANYGSLLTSDSGDFTDDIIHITKCGQEVASLGKIKSITDGLGVKTSYKYDVITRPAIYTKGKDDYSVKTYSLAFPVVANVTIETEGDYLNECSYSYQGLRIHTSGKGLLGFDSVQKNDKTSGTIETNTVTKWDTCHWIPEETVHTVTIGNNTSISKSYYNIVDMQKSCNTNNYFAYCSHQHNKDYDGYQTDTYVDYYINMGVIASECTYYDRNISNAMYKGRDYYYSEKHGTDYLPDSMVVYQKHIDDDDSIYKTISYEYDNNGNLSVVSENTESNLKFTKRYTFDEYGNKIHECAEGQNVKNIINYYDYDSTGRFIIREWTYPSSSVITYTYNVFGDMIQEKDSTDASNILVTEYKYNGWNEKTKIIYPDENFVSYSKTWDRSVSNGLYSVTETPSNAPWTKTVYDALGREVQASSVGLMGINISKTTSYDAKGNISQIVNNNGNTSITEEITYDSRGRKVSDFIDSGIYTRFSYNGREITTTSAGRSVKKTYDAWGNIKSIADAVGTVEYSYLSNGQPSSISTGGSVVRLEYDEADNKVRMDDPDAGVTIYSYAADGTLLSQTDARGVKTEYVYDALGRLKQKIYIEKNGRRSIQNNVYGTSGCGRGRIIEQSYDGHTTKFEYDRFGRVISESRKIIHQIGEYEYIKRYTYNSQGQIASVSYPCMPPNLMRIDYTYDQYGFLTETKINGWQSLFRVDSYDGQTFEANTVAGTIRKVYDDGYPLQFFLYDGSIEKGLKDEQCFSFTKHSGNLDGRTWEHNNRIMYDDESFAYDDLDRLVEVTNTNDASMFISYADNGNILSKTDIGIYTYDNKEKKHAVLSVSNENGIINSETIKTYYDVNGKLSIVEKVPSNWICYSYGPDDEKWIAISCEEDQTAISDVEHFYFGDYEKIIEDDTITEYYFLENDVILINKTYGNEDAVWSVYQAVTDHLGSILAVYDEYGHIVFRAKYDAWGKQTVELNEIGLRYGYTGHEMLSKYGLINMDGRVYDPALGRFLSPDNYVQEPENSQNFNRYSYCLNNPLKYTDPTGQVFFMFPALAGAIINVGFQYANGNINGLGDFLNAAAIGGAAGIGACVGGTIVAGAIGGGFIGGSVVGAVSSAIATGIEGLGNNWAFGTRFPTLGEFATNMAVSSLMGGIIGGVQARTDGLNFWNGKLELQTSLKIPYEYPNGVSVNSGFDIDNNKTIRFQQPTYQKNTPAGRTIKTSNPNLIVKCKIAEANWPRGSGTYSVYYGIDTKTNTVRYIGITKRKPISRFAEHAASGTNRALLRFHKIEVSGNFSHYQARLLEQTLINFYGLEKNGGQLFNKINSISSQKWSNLSLSIEEIQW